MTSWCSEGHRHAGSPLTGGQLFSAPSHTEVVNAILQVHHKALMNSKCTKPTRMRAPFQTEVQSAVGFSLVNKS